MGRSLTATCLIALVLGICLRCWDLDHKLFWVDEVYTTFNTAGYTNGEVARLFHPPQLTTAQGLIDQITGSDRPFGAMLQSLITEDTTHVPLYYALTFIWIKLFGASVASLRAVAVACSVAALPLFYDLSRRLVPSQTGAGLAVALMAVSPFHLVYSQEARPYSLWMLMTVLSSWALVCAVQQSGASKSSWLPWVGYGMTASLGLYTFLYMPLVLLAQGLYVAILYRRHWSKLRRYLWASVAAGVSFLPWLLEIAPYRHNLTGNTRWQVQAASPSPLTLLHNLGLTLARGFIDFDVNYDFSLNRWWPYGVVVLAIAALVAYGAISTIRQNPLEAWLLPVLLLVVPALSIVAIEVGLGQQQSGIPRYFTPCYVGAQLLVAFGLGQQIEREGSRLWSLVAIALIAIGALSCGNSALAETWWHKSGHYLPTVARVIAQSDAPFVLVDSDAWSFSLAYELPPETPMGLFNSAIAAPALPPGHSDYFLYNAPADWVASFQQNSGYTLAPLEGLENVPFWRVIP